MIDYAKVLDQYVAYQRAELDVLEKLSPMEFKSLEIDCALLDEKYGEAISAELLLNDIEKNTPVLYFISTGGGGGEILDKIKKLKKLKSKKAALPQLNEHHFTSNILYVGKTNSNFASRMSYHLGLRSQNTYALHLKLWACTLNLKVILYYARVPLAKEQIRYLEQMESALHYTLKPLLGRSGH